MSKHTPGPWKADKDNWVRDSEGKLLIGVPTEWRSKEEIFATRDLIAAAPEMLAALKAMMGLLDSGYLVRNIDNDHEPDWAMKQIEPVRRLKDAVDAIARAEGREP